MDCVAVLCQRKVQALKMAEFRRQEEDCVIKHICTIVEPYFWKDTYKCHRFRKMMVLMVMVVILIICKKMIN
jgi:hypothetical protein